MINITKENLVLLLKKSYQAGNLGYFDLCDLEVERILSEYFAEKNTTFSYNNEPMAVSPYMASIVSMTNEEIEQQIQAARSESF